MCSTLHSVSQSCECLVQLFVRTFMTIALMIESLVRVILQTIYNLVSFIFQLISLLPICCVFLVTSKIKCSICGGGGGCAATRGGSCDCIVTIVTLIIVVLIFRATGILDKILYRLGYIKPDSGKLLSDTVTECSRNDTDYQWYDYDTGDDDKIFKFRLKELNELDMENQTDKAQATTLDSPSTMIPTIELAETTDVSISNTTTSTTPIASIQTIQTTQSIQIARKGLTEVEYLEVYGTTAGDQLIVLSPKSRRTESSGSEWTTVLYYLVA